MALIALVMINPTVVNKEKMLLKQDGVLCYVHNATMPDFSELGYCLFREVDGRTRRIG
jgi:hypothetical protein